MQTNSGPIVWGRVRHISGSHAELLISRHYRSIHHARPPWLHPRLTGRHARGRLKSRITGPYSLYLGHILPTWSTAYLWCMCVRSRVHACECVNSSRRILSYYFHISFFCDQSIAPNIPLNFLLDVILN